MSMEQLLEQVHDYVESRGTTHQPRAYDMARLIVDLISQAEPHITAKQAEELKRLADEYAGDKALLHVIVASASDTFMKPDPHKSRAALHATLDALVKEE